MSLLIYMGAFALCCFGISLVQRFESAHYFSWNRNKIKKDSFLRFAMRMLAFMPIVLLYGFRGLGVGKDTSVYISYFHEVKEFAIEQVFGYYIEPGYVVLDVVANRIFGDEIGMQLLSGGLIFGFLIVGIMHYRRKLNEVLGVFIFFMCYFAVACNGARQLIACCIILWGIKYVLERNFLKYMLVVLAAAMFHKSAVICILFYVLSLPVCVRNSTSVQKFFLIISILELPFVDVFVKIFSSFNIYGKYIQEITVASWGELTFLVYLIPEFVLILYIKSRNKNITRDIEILTNIFVMQLPFQFMQVYLEHISRIGWYCSLVKVVLVPRLLYGLEKKQRKTWTIVICCWYLIYYIVMFVVFNGQGTYPYVFYFDE